MFQDACDEEEQRAHGVSCGIFFIFRSFLFSVCAPKEMPGVIGEYFHTAAAALFRGAISLNGYENSKVAPVIAENEMELIAEIGSDGRCFVCLRRMWFDCVC